MGCWPYQAAFARGNKREEIVKKNNLKKIHISEMQMSDAHLSCHAILSTSGGSRIFVRGMWSFPSSLFPYPPLSYTLITDSDRRQLRSAAARTCLIPRTHNKFGDRSFGAAGPRMWNSLPPHLRRDMKFAHFKRQLKTFLFGSQSTTAHCDCLLILRLRNTLTYLLTYLLTYNTATESMITP